MPPSDLQSKAGVVLGVTERAAGNMKDPAARAAALERAGLQDLPAFFLRQVHGADVVRVGPGTPAGAAPEADGWITDLPGKVLCVFVADCMPLFVWERQGAAIGAFHSGWRGTAAGMPREAVAAFQRHYGIEPRRLRAKIGPHIGACCYRVGPELEARLRPGSFRRTESGLYLDLAAEARAQLREAGLEDRAIESSGGCTSCSNDRYFSFRREKQDCRMMGFAALRPQD